MTNSNKSKKYSAHQEHIKEMFDHIHHHNNQKGHTNGDIINAFPDYIQDRLHLYIPDMVKNDRCRGRGWFWKTFEIRFTTEGRDFWSHVQAWSDLNIGYLPEIKPSDITLLT